MGAATIVRRSIEAGSTVSQRGACVRLDTSTIDRRPLERCGVRCAAGRDGRRPAWRRSRGSFPASGRKIASASATGRARYAHRCRRRDAGCADRRRAAQHAFGATPGWRSRLFRDWSRCGPPRAGFERPPQFDQVAIAIVPLVEELEILDDLVERGRMNGRAIASLYCLARANASLNGFASAGSGVPLARRRGRWFRREVPARPASDRAFRRYPPCTRRRLFHERGLRLVRAASFAAAPERVGLRLRPFHAGETIASQIVDLIRNDMRRPSMPA